jgi:hypothetical protein
MQPNRVELNCSPSSRRTRLIVLGVAALAAAALVLSNLPLRDQSPAAAPTRPSAVTPIDPPVVLEPDIQDDAFGEATIEELPLVELTFRLARFCYAMRDEFDLDPVTGLHPMPLGCPHI